MKAYWVANYTEIKDVDRLKKYAVKAKEAVEKYSGRILARSANNITLDGRDMVRVALAEFPDIETAKNCYNSEEYVEARKHLENNAVRDHIIFEGI
mgnify:CR=1 FL=1